MKPTPEQLARGLAASYALRDKGDPSKNLKPISFTGNPTAHVQVIGEAILTEEQPTLREHLQLKCSDWGTYWRASDSHGVALTIEQALELLGDALGVEVVIGSTGEADASTGSDFGCECGYGCPPGDGCRHP